MSKKITINLVNGSEGFSLQVVNKEGTGHRVAGNKAWGNPCNVPTASFELDADEFVYYIQANQYEVND